MVRRLKINEDIDNYSTSPCRCRYATAFKLDGEPGECDSMFRRCDDDYEEYESAVDDLLEQSALVLKYCDCSCRDKIASMTWFLMEELYGNPYSGFIVVDCYEPLTEVEKYKLSKYILGQNSDGLGENFEQRFSWYEDIGDDEDDGWGEQFEPRMCSFDWGSNDYTLYEQDTHYGTDMWNLIRKYAGNCD